MGWVYGLGFNGQGLGVWVQFRVERRFVTCNIGADFNSQSQGRGGVQETQNWNQEMLILYLLNSANINFHLIGKQADSRVGKTN